jgi:hypothetical protein
MVFTGLECLATHSGGVPKGGVELLNKRSSRGELDGVDSGDWERVGVREDRGGIRSRSVRLNRPDE